MDPACDRDGSVDVVEAAAGTTGVVEPHAPPVEARRRDEAAIESNVRGDVFDRDAAAARRRAVGRRAVQDEGIVHLPLASDPLRPPRSRVDPILGRPATTRWRLLEASPVPGRHWSLLELEPVTGRSHQLRVHLAWLGMPIVGDRLYPPVGAAAKEPPTARLALHATWLAFPHPRDGRLVEVRSQPPACCAESDR